MSTNTVEYWNKRLAQLQKIKNPNDYTKHQIRSAKTRIQEFRTKRNEALHSSKKDKGKSLVIGGKRKRVYDKVDRSSKLPSDYKETEAKAFEAAKKFKNNNKNNKTEPKGNTTSGQDEKVPATQGGGVKKSESLKIEKSNVFTKHYKTGKQLGVMTRNQRRAYDKAAAAHIRDKNKNKKNGK